MMRWHPLPASTPFETSSQSLRTRRECLLPPKPRSKFRNRYGDSLDIVVADAHFHALDASFVGGNFGVTVELDTR